MGKIFLKGFVAVLAITFSKQVQSQDGEKNLQAIKGTGVHGEKRHYL